RPGRPHHRIMVLDRAGALVLAIPRDSRDDAEVVARDVFPRLASASSEAISAKGLMGRPEIVGLVPVDNAPQTLFVGVAIDHDVTMAEAKRVNEQNLVVALVTMMLAIFGAWFTTLILINRPIR